MICHPSWRDVDGSPVRAWASVTASGAAGSGPRDVGLPPPPSLCYSRLRRFAQRPSPTMEDGKSGRDGCDYVEEGVRWKT